VVLKFDQNPMHHGGLGAIRSLGRLGVPVYGVHEGPWSPAAASAYLQGRWFWQPDAEQVERTTAGLLALAERIGRPSVLITTDDAGAIFLAEHGGPLREAFRFPAPPPSLPRLVAGKLSLHELCRREGVPSPRTQLPGSLAEAEEFAAGAGYPLVAKLATPWSAASAGLRSTTVVAGAEALRSLWTDCERAGAGLLLQEYIEAGPGDDWFFHGYSGGHSPCRPAFTGIKDRSYPAHAGLTSYGRAVPNERLAGAMTGMLERLSYRGIMDLDLRRDRRDGEYKLLDFNPRLGAQFRIFRDSADLDVVLAAYLDLTGQPVPAGEQLDRKFVVENYDPIGALGYWRRGELSPSGWLASLRGVDEAAWFARDDLRPFGLMCLRMSMRAVTRRFASHGGAAASPEPRYRDGRAAGRTPRQTRTAADGGSSTTENGRHDPEPAAVAGPREKGDHS
jgi:predicted ATP-grasp superfamily ATP-dependent carboligase